MKINDIFKYKTSNWKVKVVYFTKMEVCVESLETNNTFDVKFLSLFLLNHFLNQFELCK